MAAGFAIVPGMVLMALVYLALFAGAIYLVSRDQTRGMGLVACAMLLFCPLVFFFVARATVVPYYQSQLHAPGQVTIAPEFQQTIKLPPMPIAPAPVLTPRALTQPTALVLPTPQEAFASQARLSWAGVGLLIFIILAVAIVAGFATVFVLIPKNVRSGTLKGSLICAALMGAVVGIYLLREGEAPNFSMRISPPPMPVEQYQSTGENLLQPPPAPLVHPSHPGEVLDGELLMAPNDALRELARQALENGSLPATPANDSSGGTKLVIEPASPAVPAPPAATTTETATEPPAAEKPATEPTPSEPPTTEKPATESPTAESPAAEATVAESSKPEPTPVEATAAEPEPAEPPAAAATSAESIVTAPPAAESTAAESTVAESASAESPATTIPPAAAIPPQPAAIVAEQSPDNTLSIAPTTVVPQNLPQLPAWASQEQTVLGDTIYVTVSTDPHQNLESCRYDLELRVWNIAMDRAALDLGQHLPLDEGWRQSFPPGFLNQLIADRHLERRETSSLGPVNIFHARVRFTPENRALLADRAKRILVRQRVATTGLGVVAGLALLSLVYGGLKWRERRKPAQLLAKAAT